MLRSDYMKLNGVLRYCYVSISKNDNVEAGGATPSNAINIPLLNVNGQSRALPLRDGTMCFRI